MNLALAASFDPDLIKDIQCDDAATIEINQNLAIIGDKDSVTIYQLDGDEVLAEIVISSDEAEELAAYIIGLIGGPSLTVDDIDLIVGLLEGQDHYIKSEKPSNTCLGDRLKLGKIIEKLRKVGRKIVYG